MADLFAKVSCTYCEEEITGIRVQCCVCQDFDICLQCFSTGAEIGTHKNDHAYKFVEHWSVSIFGGKGNWTGGEELQLLDAVELYGFGNWELVSQHVETRTPEEVRDEYISRYLDGNIGKATWAESRDRQPMLIDHVPEDNGPLSPAVIARLPPLDITLEEAQLLGYKPHRDDFEREYDMPAEQLVSTLQLDTAEDTEVEVALKLSMVDMYTRRLRERAKRKRIVRDYQLVAKFFSNQRKDSNKRPLTKEQRELRENMKVFSQFLTSNEHEQLINNLEREKELRHRLSELYRYRSLGLTTQEEVIHQEQHMAYQKQQQMKQSKSGSSGYQISVPEVQSKNGKSEENQNLSEKKFTWSEEQNNSNSDNVRPPSPNALPLGSLLSQHEIQLCKTLNLQPVQYTTLKSLIIQENLLSPNRHRTVEIDKNSSEVSVKDVVTQYLSHSGWLPGVSVV
ncbi:transcriptional adapter 2B [Tribolium castaneum]|uniref:Transcriptional adapter n=1 Tax=Tribolium castaneum TaxID=7070 RepID=D6WTS8_TRICA|nr:PREDICTED: transcriptional adapter 2B [Tribolium castaneum]EFA06279.1 Transcriptional adapter 2B-like Protein [Tribolium castaneum]|eukprot:XP_008195462.1 PREDICTED: transcriptional adapter 2B [Tribolium castaneum]